MNDPTTVSRREFARAAAALAAAAVLPASALAQEAKPPAPETTPSPIKPPDYESEMTPAMRAEAESKYQWVLQRYGDRLDAEQRAEVRKSIYGGQKSLQALRDFPLDNADAPNMLMHLKPAPQGRR